MTPFMQVGNYPTKNFATLEPLELRLPFIGDSIIRSLKKSRVLLTFQHRAGVRPYTSFYNFAESCAFNKQLSPPILCPKKLFLGLLLPKLRRNFAEFLQYG